MDGRASTDAAVDAAWTTWARAARACRSTPPRRARQARRRHRAGAAAPRPDQTRGVAAAARRPARPPQYDDLADVVSYAGALDPLAGLALPWAVVTSADDRLARPAGRADHRARAWSRRTTSPSRQARPEGLPPAGAALGVDSARCLVSRGPGGGGCGPGAVPASPRSGVEGASSIADPGRAGDPPADGSLDSLARRWFARGLAPPMVRSRLAQRRWSARGLAQRRSGRNVHAVQPTASAAPVISTWVNGSSSAKAVHSTRPRIAVQRGHDRSDGRRRSDATLITP